MEIIGLLGATLTTMSFLPQAIKTLRTRETEAISLWMYLIFASGVTCWFIYGLLLHNFPIIIANAVTLPLVLSILYVKITTDRRR